MPAQLFYFLLVKAKSPPLATWFLIIYGETKLDSLGDFFTALRCVPQKKGASEYDTSINSAIGSVINTNYSIEIKDTYS